MMAPFRSRLIALCLVLAILAKTVPAQHSDPECIFGDLCTGGTSPMCPPTGGSCTDDGTGCLDASGNSKECKKPRNECHGVYCAKGYFCGMNTKVCVKSDDCQALQLEMCPESMKDGNCTAGGTGEGCPPTFMCRFTGGKSCKTCNLDGNSYVDGACKDGGWKPPEGYTGPGSEEYENATSKSNGSTSQSNGDNGETSGSPVGYYGTGAVVSQGMVLLCVVSFLLQ